MHTHVWWLFIKIRWLVPLSNAAGRRISTKCQSTPKLRESMRSGRQSEAGASRAGISTSPQPEIITAKKIGHRRCLRKETRAKSQELRIKRREPVRRGCRGFDSSHDDLAWRPRILRLKLPACRPPAGLIEGTHEICHPPNSFPTSFETHRVDAVTSHQTFGRDYERDGMSNLPCSDGTGSVRDWEFGGIATDVWSGRSKPLFRARGRRRQEDDAGVAVRGCQGRLQVRVMQDGRDSSPGSE